jgi:hypothetical protein
VEGGGGEPVHDLATFFVGLFFLSGALLAFAVVARSTLNARHAAVGDYVAKKDGAVDATGDVRPFVRVTRQLAALLAGGLVLLIGIGVIGALLDENPSGKAAAVAVGIGALSIMGALLLYRWIRGPRPMATNAAPRASTMPVPIRILRGALVRRDLRRWGARENIISMLLGGREFSWASLITPAAGVSGRASSGQSSNLG